MLFFDIKKAFDHVCLSGLLYKLQAVGVRGKALAWFKIFLCNRQQRTVVGRRISSSTDLHAGVPEGAILSTLLFSLYMNDVVQATGEDVNMFADDTSVCTYDKSVAGLQTKLQLAVDTLAAWFGSWALTINRQKSAVMVFTTACAVPLLNITLDSEPVSQVLSHKHLRLLLDSHLS